MRCNTEKKYKKIPSSNLAHATCSTLAGVETSIYMLQDPNQEKMEPLLMEPMGELRERRQERGEPRSHAPGAQDGARRSWWRRVLGG